MGTRKKKKKKAEEEEEKEEDEEAGEEPLEETERQRGRFVFISARRRK